MQNPTLQDLQMELGELEDMALYQKTRYEITLRKIERLKNLITNYIIN